MGVDVIRIPVRGPVANAISERFVGSVRCRILIVSAAHATRVLGEYEAHFNTPRPHGSLGQAAPLRALPSVPANPTTAVSRRDRLGGLIHEYAQVV
jgi:putative transposase